MVALDGELGIDAPAGINPYVYLVIFLFVGPPAILWKLGPPILNWFRSRQERAALKGNGETPSYRVSQAEIRRIGDDYKRISEAYREIVKENSERDKRIDDLEEEVGRERRVTWKLAEYLRDVIKSHRTHAPDVDLPPPPELIEKYI